MGKPTTSGDNARTSKYKGIVAQGMSDHNFNLSILESCRETERQNTDESLFSGPPNAFWEEFDPQNMELRDWETSSETENVRVKGRLRDNANYWEKIG